MATETGDTPEEERERTKANVRLHDMVVESVDLVDRPANLKRFLIVKREDKMGNTNGENSDLETVGVADPESGAQPDPAATGAATGDAGADTGAAATGDTKPKPVAKEGDAEDDAAKARGEGQGVGGSRQGDGGASVCVCPKCGEEIEHSRGTPCAEAKCPKCGASMVGKGDVAKAIPTPVRDAVVKTLREAGERLVGVNNALRSATVTQDRVNAPLPDAVFREIKAVQTLVKSILQRYPFPSAAGTAEKAEGDPVDVGLEMSVALMKQAGEMKIPEPVRDAVAASVREASETVLSIANAVKDMATTDETVDAPLPAETAKSIGEVLGTLETVLEKYPAPAAKSDAAMAVLEKSFDAIRDVVKGFAAGEIIVKSEGGAASIEIDKLVETVKAQADTVAKLTADVAKLSGQPGASNALEDAGGGAEDVNKGAGKTAWPQDIAADIKKRDEEAATKK